MIEEKEEIRKVIQDHIKSNEQSDWEGFLKSWHPEAKRLNVGNSNELYITSTEEIRNFSFEGLKNLRTAMPDAEISFIIDDFLHIDVYDNVVASVELEWQMKLPGSKGYHRTYFHLVKMDENWTIVNVLDRGLEESD